MAVFLAAPYAEALFAALAFWAWLLARRGAWVWAGLLAAGATLVRVNGLFLAIGLVVLFLTSRPRPWATRIGPAPAVRRSRRVRRIPALAHWKLDRLD